MEVLFSAGLKGSSPGPRPDKENQDNKSETRNSAVNNTALYFHFSISTDIPSVLWVWRKFVNDDEQYSVATVHYVTLVPQFLKAAATFEPLCLHYVRVIVPPERFFWAFRSQII